MEIRMKKKIVYCDDMVKTKIILQTENFEIVCLNRLNPLRSYACVCVCVCIREMFIIYMYNTNMMKKNNECSSLEGWI